MFDIDKVDQNMQDNPIRNDRDEEMHLDDARRVKVLSPGMLVFKRFIRNRLAVIGFGILLFMFTFAFLGPVISPYGQAQVFKGMDSMSKEYAGAIYNQELRYTTAEDEEFSSGARAQFLFALGKNEVTFTHNDDVYYYVSEGEDVYRILQLDPIAEVLMGIYNPLTGDSVPKALIAAYQSAVDKGLNAFELNGISYRITKDKKANRISTEHDVALAMLYVHDAYQEADSDDVSSYDFKLISSRALAQNKESFSMGNQDFSIRYDEGQATILDDAGNEYAEVSNIIVNPLDKAVFLPVDFKAAIRQAINDRENKFTYTDDAGETVEYTIVRVNNTYNVKKETPIEMIRVFEAPSSTHPLGLDNNGMDVMTRLMFGGRVSLLVGFVVIFIEVSIGIIIGGISGYFGGWVDTALMRFVDLFNSIPSIPMILIFGSVMDTLEVDPMARIFLLMLVLGLLGWTGIARVVRGQILSLREQDFMVATEATGIRTSRRIFRHLVPNVMPLLIVQATAGLGAVIITEATLGFLGLGVKYPLASWGSIINIASDAFVMTNFWFMWIPAGLLILLTVLGFNFVGDGLRDAYDPKMKR
ncbi:MAG: ABC transporter permease [Anaerolineaceae bacterium]|jgi:peptide/nickel transport system permease protein|nr:ABC transporter permease [Anaerolineaceae bacterium]